MSEEISDVADALEIPFSRNARNITNLLNAIRESGDIALYADLASPFETIIQGLISGDSDLAATLLTALLKQSAGESVIGVTEAISLSTYKSQGVILGRLDKIHESATAVPPAAGYGDNSNRVWVGGFGSWAKQKSEDGIDGYDYDSGGVSIGYDRMVDSVPGLRFGVAGSFSTGDLKSSNGAAKVDIDTFSFGLYGSYLASNSVFFDATVSYGSSNNDSEVRLLNAAGVYGGVKKGSFDIDTFLAGARVGKIISFDNVNVTPSLGVRYLNFSQEGWRETITGTGGLGLANWFGKRSDSVVEIPLQVKINGTFEAGSATVTPELRLGWTLMAKKPDNELTIGFVGSDLSTTVFGTKARTNSFQVGAGVKIDVGDTVDIFANYDLDVAKKYTDHVASLGVGFNF
jgi:outer membrane autotransporter protein